MNFIVVVSIFLNRALRKNCGISYIHIRSTHVGEIIMDNSQIENTISVIRKRSGVVTVFNKDKISKEMYQI